jgi:Dolichyl-phosphate-mannose-protein mannosyltransferase
MATPVVQRIRRWLPRVDAGVLVEDYVAIGVLVCVVAGLYALLPKQGDIWWPDASRHALNGAFVLDFLHQLPLRHPVEFAYNYYRQYPALTIGFYPPLFSVVLAGFYTLFGVFEAAALFCELSFLLLLACGTYRLSRYWLDPVPALGATLLLIGAPELLFWGQQIMLDIPAYAFLIWAAEFYLRYLKGADHRWLYLATVFAVAAVCTKYNAIFFVAIMGVVLLYGRGWRVLFDRTVVRAAILGALLMLPVVVIFFVFARYNLQQAGAAPVAASNTSGAAVLTYYATVLPAVVSWPTVFLACGYLIFLPFVPAWRLNRVDARFLILWVVIGYAFYSAIAVKEPRHILFITYPLAMAAVLLLERLFVRLPWRSLLSLVVAIGVFSSSLIMRPAPYVRGLRESAEIVARLAPPDTNVAFWGHLDGTFIYAMRSYSGRPDLGVLRVDKILFRDVAVYFEAGLKENDLTPARITDEISNFHAQYVVVQTGYMSYYPAVQALEAAVHSDKFIEIQRIAMSSNYSFTDISELVIYRLVADVPHNRVSPPLQIMLLGKTL